MEIVTLPILKAHLGISGTSQDELLTQLEKDAADWVEKQLDQRFRVPAARTEYQIGQGQLRLILDGHIGAGTPTVTEKFSPSSSATPFTAFDVRGDVLQRNDGQPWLNGAEYAVTYQDGYAVDDVPGDIKMLVADVVRIAHDKATDDGITSESIGDYSYDIAAVAGGEGEQLGGTAKRTLDKWRKMRI